MKWVIVFAVLAASAMVYRLADLQIRNPEDLAENGLHQRLRIQDIPANRGEILDRNGVPLVQSLDAKSFFADPQHVEDPIEAARRLAPVIGKSEESLRAIFSASNRFGWLARRVSPGKAAEIGAMSIPGVFGLVEPERSFPAGRGLAQSLIGHVNADLVGTSGVEKLFDDKLKGEAGLKIFELGTDGQTIPGKDHSEDLARDGSAVNLTIDRTLQWEAERILRRQVQEMGADSGVVLITRPSTGEVLAMAEMGRTESGVETISQNLSQGWNFDPGSIMKPMVFAAVLESGLAEPDTAIDVPDTYLVYDAEFTDVVPHPPVPYTVNEILTRSSNVGTVLWAQSLGAETLNRYLRGFGFGAPVRFDFPGARISTLPPGAGWGEVDSAAASLGQGVEVTPIEMITAYNVIANDGIYRPLQVVSSVVDADGTVEYPEVGQMHRVISADTAREVRTMLTNAVENGTGKNAQVAGYQVAGKTGTGRQSSETGYEDAAGNYSYVSSFVGLLPASDPELSILVSIDNPNQFIAYSGGQVAAPVFAELASYAARRFRIATNTTVSLGDPSQRTEFGPVSDRIASEVAVAAPEPVAAEADAATEAAATDTSESDTAPSLDNDAANATDVGDSGSDSEAETAATSEAATSEAGAP